MKEKRIDYLVDNFVDEYGDTRHFVICAVSYILDKRDVLVDVGKGAGFCKIEESVAKGVKLGYSFCRPKYTDKNGVIHEDTFDVELGKSIALGRARKNADYALLAMHEGDINSDVVQALIKRRAKYFKNNPASMINGYKREK